MVVSGCDDEVGKKVNVFMIVVNFEVDVKDEVEKAVMNKSIKQLHKIINRFQRIKSNDLCMTLKNFITLKSGCAGLSVTHVLAAP